MLIPTKLKSSSSCALTKSMIYNNGMGDVDLADQLFKEAGDSINPGR